MTANNEAIMFELDDLGPLSSLSEVLSPLPKQSSPTLDYEEVNDDDDDDDECDYDDDEDDDEEGGVDTSYQDPSINRYDNNQHRRFFDHIHQQRQQRQQQRVVYLLGQAHVVNNQHPTTTIASSSTAISNNSIIELIQNYQQHLYWFTYRSELLVPLRPYNSIYHAPHSFAWNATHHTIASPFAKSIITNTTNNNNDNDKIIATVASIDEETNDNTNIGSSNSTCNGTTTGMKTDAGWGCMLRSAQMLLAETVRRHYSSSLLLLDDESTLGGKCSNNITNNDNNKSNLNDVRDKDEKKKKNFEGRMEKERIARWFADFPNHHTTTYHSSTSTTTTTTLNNNKDFVVNSNKDDDDGGIDYHWYSLHSMVAAGLGLGMLPGEWYGPNMICHVLLELNSIHCACRQEQILQRNNRRNNDNGRNESYGKDDGDNKASTTLLPSSSCDVFRVHVATGGTIYVDAITKLMTSSTTIQRQQQQQQQQPSQEEEASGQNQDEALLPSVEEFDDPLRSTTTTKLHGKKSNHEEDDDDYIDDDGGVEWDTSLLLLLPLRLGINSISTCDYGMTLSKLMSFPHSVGMIGGTPRHALWFYGADAIDDDDNSHQNDCDGGWYGLDPHIVQLAPRGVRVSNNVGTIRTLTTGTAPTSWEDVCNDMASVEDVPPATATAASIPTYRWQVQLTNSYLTSLHTSHTGITHPNHKRAIPLSKLDPSCALGFYIRNRSDFIHLRQLIRNLKNEQHRNKLPDVITVMTRTPRYELDNCSAGVLMNDSVDCGLDGFAMPSDDVEREEENDNDDDDDDFVLI